MKPYTWEEIESFLTKELETSKHILTYGTIGSKNVKNDVDIIITKQPTSSARQFYAEIHHLHDSLNSFISEKYNAKVIAFGHSCHEIEVKHLASYTEKDLLLHVMIHASYKQMIRFWHPDADEEVVKNIIRNEYETIHGKKEEVLDETFNIEVDEHIYCWLNYHDRSNSQLPQNILREKHQEFARYISKRYSIPIPEPDDPRELFYKICDCVRINKTYN